MSDGSDSEMPDAPPIGTAAGAGALNAAQFNPEIDDTLPTWPSGADAAGESNAPVDPNVLSNPLSELNMEDYGDLHAAYEAESNQRAAERAAERAEEARQAEEEERRRQALLAFFANEDNFEEEAHEQEDALSDDDVAAGEDEDGSDDESSDEDPDHPGDDASGDDASGDEDEGDRSPQLTTRGTVRQRQPRRSREQKYKQILGEMKTSKLPPKQWMKMYNGAGQPSSKKTRRHIRQSMEALEHEHVFSGRVIRQELKKLIGKPSFDQYDPEQSMDDVQFSAMHKVIEDTAPNWVRFLQLVLPNKKISLKKAAEGEAQDFHQKQDRMRKRIAIMTQMAARSIALQKASVFGKRFGLYLVTSGVPFHVISVINNMGLCASGRSTQVLLKKTAAVQDQRAVDMARTYQIFIVYDNFVRQKNRKGVQVVGGKTQMLQMTTSYIARSTRIPETGLTKDMIDPSLKLEPNDVIGNLLHDNCTKLRKHLSCYHIDQALEIAFKEELKEVFHGFDFKPRFEKQLEEARSMPRMGIHEPDPYVREGEAKSRFPWPSMDEMDPSESTDVVPMNISMNDEVSISGTKQVLKDIFLDNLKLDEEKDFGHRPQPGETAEQAQFLDGQSRLFPMVGDQMTNARFLSCQAEGVEAELPFDQYNWGVITPGWLHVCMNKALGLVATHFDTNSDGQQLAHCLLRDASFFNMSGISKKNAKYFLTLNLLARSYRSRVVALFMQELIDMGLLQYSADENRAKNRIGIVKAAVQKLTPEQYLQIVETLQKKAFTKDAWQNKYTEDDQLIQDADYTTMCRMLIQIEELLTMRVAIRKMDVGHLERMVDYLVIPFLGTGQSNYSRHLLHLRWLLKQRDPRLRRAVMGISVVNPSGKRGKGIASDEEIELINNALSQDLAHLGNSTHDMEAVVRKKASNHRAAQAMKKMFVSGIGVEGTNYHTNKNAVTDIMSLADKIVRDGFAERQPVGEGQADERVLSDDIQQLGIEKLTAAMEAFNSSNEQRSLGLTQSAGEAVADGVDAIDGADARERGNAGGGDDRGPISAAAIDEDDDVYIDHDGFHWLGGVETVDLTGDSAGDVGGNDNDLGFWMTGALPEDAERGPVDEDDDFIRNIGSPTPARAPAPSPVQPNLAIYQDPLLTEQEAMDEAMGIAGSRAPLDLSAYQDMSIPEGELIVRVSADTARRGPYDRRGG